MNIFLSMTCWGLSCVYGGLVRLRNNAYQRGIFKIYESRVPVISVGNVSAGGNAKTPLAIYIAQELMRRSFSPVIVSRGYRGRVRELRLVRAADSPSEVGDEPLLMAREYGLKVVVHADRVRAVQWIEQEGLADVIILDDGFQHRRLGRTIDIVSVNMDSQSAVEDFLDGRLLPLGLFREPRDVALQRAHMIVFAERRIVRGKTSLDERLLKIVPPSVQIYRAQLESSGVVAIAGGPSLAPQRVGAFCGIANPEGFFSSLRELGFHVAYEKRFPDHHLFSARDLEMLRAESGGLPLVSTQKDAVKLGSLDTKDLYVLRIALKVVPGDAFVSQVLKMITRALVPQAANSREQ